MNLLELRKKIDELERKGVDMTRPIQDSDNPGFYINDIIVDESTNAPSLEFCEEYELPDCIGEEYE